jgi:hypothetical protein
MKTPRSFSVSLGVSEIPAPALDETHKTSETPIYFAN